MNELRRDNEESWEGKWDQDGGVDGGGGKGEGFWYSMGEAKYIKRQKQRKFNSIILHYYKNTTLFHYMQYASNTLHLPKCAVMRPD